MWRMIGVLAEPERRMAHLLTQMSPILALVDNEASKKMKPENWIAIVQICFTLFGMFVASKLAIRGSIKQFRSQKWWERQGDVYNRLLENLAIIKHCVAARLEHARHPDYMLPPNQLLEEQLATAAAEVEKIGGVGPYYLSETASQAVGKFLAGWSVDTGIGPEDQDQWHLTTVSEAMKIIRKEATKALDVLA